MIKKTVRRIEITRKPLEKISIRKSKTAIPGLLDLIAYISVHTDVPLYDFEMVEVGSFVGDSTRVFAGVVKTVNAVDPWKNHYDDDMDPSSYKWDMKIIEAQFDEVVAECGNIIKNRMASVEGAEMFEDGSLDMVYIDGNHKYEFVKEDIRVWLPKIKKGGFLCGHDYGHKLCPGTKPAIHEMVGPPDAVFQDTSWVKKV